MNKDLKKQDLVKVIADEVGLSLKHATLAVDVIFESISKALVSGDSVQVYQFGKFCISKRSERTGVNPSTGQKIKIPASNGISFKASSALKDLVNKKKK